MFSGTATFRWPPEGQRVARRLDVDVLGLEARDLGDESDAALVLVDVDARSRRLGADRPGHFLEHPIDLTIEESPRGVGTEDGVKHDSSTPATRRGRDGQLGRRPVPGCAPK